MSLRLSTHTQEYPFEETFDLTLPALNRTSDVFVCVRALKFQRLRTTDSELLTVTHTDCVLLTSLADLVPYVFFRDNSLFSVRTPVRSSLDVFFPQRRTTTSGIGSCWQW